MEFFASAASIRLRSNQGRYLTAAPDEKSVTHKKDGKSRAAVWTVEPVEDSRGFFRLRSCVGLLLTASDTYFLLGVTGFKVLQTARSSNNTSVEWKPLRYETSSSSSLPCVKLSSRRDTFLRATGNPAPPYWASVTHQKNPLIKHKWSLWHVEVVGYRSGFSPPMPAVNLASPSGTSPPSGNSSPDLVRDVGWEDEAETIRTIHCQVLDDDGEVDSRYPDRAFPFRGSSLQKLRRRIEDLFGIPDVILCVQDATRFNKLHKIRLGLPPDRLTMTIFAVPSSSSGLGPISTINSIFLHRTIDIMDIT